jgi:hypothetical protein
LGRIVDLAETSVLRNPYVQASVNRSREIVGEALNQLCKIEPLWAERIPDVHQASPFVTC